METGDAINELQSVLDALNRSYAVIHFSTDGTILDANDNFLATVGYRLEEIRGKHHRIFVSSEYENSEEYRTFWQRLARGEFFSDQYQRFGKDGKEVWLEASYNPILDHTGKPYKIVKYAADVTDTVFENAAIRGQIDAIDKSYAMIEFEPDGTIVHANENFLRAVGYRLDEIQGRHHKLFVDDVEARSPEYRTFWGTLAKGQFFARVFKRIRKNGDPIWIQATYNPIMGPNGYAIKVVKYATDVTDIVQTATVADGVLSVVEGVSNAIEEMTSSLSHINSNVNSARTCADDILRSSQEASEVSEHLIQSMTAMQEAVDLISTIASQINLLALNARIEAARAGEAGNGFAVVASEVKNLANKTTEATGELSTRIQKLQSVAASVFENAGSISKSADLVTQSVVSVSQSVEEQTGAAHEMATNAQTMTGSVHDIVTRIRALSEA